ncbi:MAG: UPF0280 family protein [Methanobacterium paludis]|nr:UPF0280 family protein [Methanobacterium paludis]
MTTSRIIRERIQIEETNILLRTDLKKHYLPNFILEQRMELTAYIRVHPEFLTSLEPFVVETVPPTPLIVSMMARAGRRAEVGPMAAVAGTIAQLSMGFMLKNGAKYVIVDNGGDVALKKQKNKIR